MGQGYGIKVATKSLTRQRRLAPGEVVLAYAVADNMAAPFGRLDVVLTTEAVFIGPNVQHASRFALDDIVVWDFREGFHFATADGYRIDLRLRGSFDLDKLLGRQLGNRARASPPPPPPPSPGMPPGPGGLAMNIAYVGIYAESFGASVFDSPRPCMLLVDDHSLSMLMEQTVMFHTREDTMTFAAWRDALPIAGMPTVTFLELGFQSKNGQDCRIALAAPERGLFQPTVTDEFLKHPTSCLVLDPLMRISTVEHPNGCQILPLLPA
ncbi:hypothetical protein acdb102_31330 [Acidothermaceae bacterium B102]|nr:hypothetical protein acdb102_31330 [Acidothermaceae bacterium B102]